MPKVRKPEVTSAIGTAPAELRNPDHRIWLSGSQSASWLVRQGLDPLGSHRKQFADLLPLSRHHAAVMLWVQSAGLTQSFGSNTKYPDWAAVRAAGIPASGGRRVMAELEQYTKTMQD